MLKKRLQSFPLERETSGYSPGKRTEILISKKKIMNKFNFNVLGGASFETSRDQKP